MKSRGRLVAGLLACAALACTVGAVPARGDEPRGLRVTSAGPAWSGGAMTLSVTPAVSLPVPHFSVSVFSGGRLLGEASVPGRGGLVTLPAGLAAGRHDLLVKSGDLAGRVRVRVLPAGFGPVAAGVLIGWLAVAAQAVARRR